MCHAGPVSALVRTVRRQRGLTLEHLADRTGLTKSYLSKIERGHAIPSIAAAMKVARALDVDVARLFSDEPAHESITVERATVSGRYRALGTTRLGKTMSPFVVRPSGTGPEDPHPTHGGEEFVFVHTGRIALHYGDRVIDLGTGDSAYFDASVDHRIAAVGEVPAEVVVVTCPRPGDPR